MARPMIGDNRLIMVIDGANHCGPQLKELIEFMDEPEVCVARPEDWLAQIGDHRLAAVFLGHDLPKDDFNHLIEDIGELDPNIPIVLIGVPADD